MFFLKDSTPFNLQTTLQELIKKWQCYKIQKLKKNKIDEWFGHPNDERS